MTVQREEKRQIVRLVLSALLLVPAWLLPTRGWVRLLTFLPAFAPVFAPVLKEAAESLLHGGFFDENLLMTLAALGAMALGEYPEAVAVMLFFQLGELLETLSEEKTRRSVTELMDIRPDYAELEEEMGTRRVSPEQVQPGQRIVVRPGEKIPLDGVIEEGVCLLDNRALTGETDPCEAGPGSEVLSGGVDLTGVLRIRVTKSYEDSTVSRILALVEEAAQRKSASERFISRFARRYTPAVVGAAVLLGVIPPLFGAQWALWLKRALVFLTVSCPCALVISVPLTFFGGIGAAARCGILIKGSNFLDDLAKVKTVVFDKTGTLTEGRFSLTTIHAQTVSERELLELAALAEHWSNHPAALCIRKAWTQPVDESRVSALHEQAGFGVEAVVDGRRVLAGNARLLEMNGVSVPQADAEGVLIHFARDGAYLGFLTAGDRVKPEAKRTVCALRQLGVTKTVMLTGDREENARKTAREIGLDEYFAHLLPQQKVERLESLLTRTRGKVIFVGDGVNDAPVLARADLGAAMGALGSDAAVEAADVVLMEDRLSRLPDAIRIARRTRGIAVQNIVLALSVKAAVLLLGALGRAGLWMAVAADVGVMLLAALNAARALKIKGMCEKQ